MRWISVGVLCSISRDIDGDLIPKMQLQFIYQLPKHTMHTTDDRTNVLVFWDKIPIVENTNMHDKTRQIEDAVNTSNMVVVDYGEDPTFWKKHGERVVTTTGAFGIGAFIWYLSVVF